MSEYTIHPVANLLPELSDDELTELVADIEQNGQREPILALTDGQIVDGRHRYKACQIAGIEPKIKTVAMTEPEITAMVISANVHRRHLTASQRAMAIVEVRDWPSNGQHPASSAPGAEQATTGQMAKAVGVSPRTIEHAKAAERNGLSDKVLSGEMSAKAAAKADKPRMTQAEKDLADLSRATQKFSEAINRCIAAQNSNLLPADQRDAALDVLATGIDSLLQQPPGTTLAAIREAEPA